MVGLIRIIMIFLPQKQIIWGWTVLILFLQSIFPAHASSVLYLQELIRQLGIKQHDFVNLEAGKVVSFNIAENNDKELAVGAIIYVPALPTEIIEYVKNKNMASVDADVISQYAIPAHAAPETFKGINFEGEQNEAVKFLAAKPGNLFNLSTQELQALQVISPTQIHLASQIYNKILWHRFHAYLNNGLKGIATYDRGAGKEADPGEELLTATKNDKKLAHHFPELYTVWLNYPAPLPSGADEQFFLVNRQVEGRPTAVLMHRVILNLASGGIILSRQFYVGHSYNSSQLSIECLPYRNGSMLISMSRTFTDQVTGFGSSLKRVVGRGQKHRKMVGYLRNLSDNLKKSGSLNCLNYHSKC